MSVPIKQTKFSGGEVAPSLYGDISWPKYPASLRTCKNWIPTSQGAAVNRPGTVDKGSIKDPSNKGRLVPFVFSDAQAFLLEFGDLYVRFWKNGQYIGTTGLNSGVPRELVTPWTLAMLPYLKFSQVGDVITFTYGGQVGGQVAPRDIRHTAGALWPWTIGLTPLKIPAGAYVSLAAFTQDKTGGATYDAAFAYSTGHRVASANQEWISLQDASVGHAPALGSLYWALANDGTHYPQNWSWVWTAILQDPNGVVYETPPCPVYSARTTLGPDRPLAIDLGLINGLAAGWVELYRRVYRSVTGQLYGWLEDTSYGLGFTDRGQEPDYTQQPPASTDPFLVNGVDYYPAVIGYLDQRRLWAATAAVPQMIVLSKAGDLYRYDRPVPGADSDSLLHVIASEVLEQVRSFAPMKRGILLTGQGEWLYSGAQGGAISKSSLDLKRQSKWGSNWLNPIIIGNGLVFNTAKSNMVRDFSPLYGLYADVWDGEELSWHARHLMDLHTITAWAYQSVPNPVLWMVRDDGVLLSLTYDKKREVVAWAQHTIGGDGATVEDVCVVPEPPEDAVYLIVNRTKGGLAARRIERMSSPVCPAAPAKPGVSDPRYGVYLDCSATYDGHNTDGTTAQLSAPSDPAWGVLTQATLTTSVGKFAAADEGKSSVVFDPDGAPVEAKIVHYTSPTVVTVELQSALTALQIATWATSATTNWGLAKSVFSNASIGLYGADSGEKDGARGAKVLADGNPQDPNNATWFFGTMTLSKPAVVITLGLSYNCDIELLDMHHPSVEIRNKAKKLVRIGFEVGGARGLWAGQSFDTLWEWEQRKVADSYANVPLAVGYFEADTTDEWNKEGRAVIRQIDPLPVVLLSVLREVELGGVG